MKNTIKFYLMVAFCFFYFIQESSAQQKNHIYVGYGIATADDIGNELADIVITAISGGKITTANSKYSGAIFAGYRTYITPKLEVGGTFVYERGAKDVLVDGKDGGTLTTNSYGLLAELKYNYINHTRFRLHSGIGAGMAHSQVSTEESEYKTDKENTNSFAYQVDAIGATYGDKFSISLNAGFGYKGIINAVLAYGF